MLNKFKINKMKKLILLVVIGMLFIGCAKDPDHYLRVTNSDSLPINDLKIGALNYGDISGGSTTSYKYITEGTHDISGSIGFTTLGGSFSVTGNGTHNWTLTLNSSGSIGLVEDK